MARHKGLTGRQEAAVKVVFGDLADDILAGAREAAVSEVFKDKRQVQAASAAEFWRGARVGSADARIQARLEAADARRVRRAWGRFFGGGS